MRKIFNVQTGKSKSKKWNGVREKSEVHENYENKNHDFSNHNFITRFRRDIEVQVKCPERVGILHRLSQSIAHKTRTFILSDYRNTLISKTVNSQPNNFHDEISADFFHKTIGY